MRFANIPMFIAALVLTAALVVASIIFDRRRRKIMELFVDRAVMDRVTLFYSARARRIATMLTVAAAALMAFALARPQWDYAWQENKRKGLDIVIGIDTSRSMLADDLKPSRLEFAKSEVKEFVKKLKGDRLGLIAFSGTSFPQCPLTVDYRGYLLALDSLSTETVSRGGTALSSAIKEAVRCYKGAETGNKVFILITDGEHHEGDIDKAAEAARKAGVRVYCIGVGTPEGVKLFETDERGVRVPVMDGLGAQVVTRLDEETLRRVASRTGGSYVRATAERFGLEELYRDTLSKLEKREFESDRVKVYEERFQYVLAVACFLLLAGMIIKERRDDEA